MPVEFESWKIATLQQISEITDNAGYYASKAVYDLRITRGRFTRLLNEPTNLVVPTEEASLYDFLSQSWEQTQRASTITECLQAGITFRKLLKVRWLLESAGLNSFEKMTIPAETPTEPTRVPEVTAQPIPSTREIIIVELEQLRDHDQRANLEQIGQKVKKTRAWVQYVYSQIKEDLGKYHRGDLLPPLFQLRGEATHAFDNNVKSLVKEDLHPQQIVEKLSPDSRARVFSSLKRLRTAGEAIPQFPRLTPILDSRKADIAKLRKRHLGNQAIADILKLEEPQVTYVLNRLIATDPTLRLRAPRRSPQQLARIDAAVAKLQQQGKTYRKMAAELGISHGDVSNSVTRLNRAKTPKPKMS